MGIPRHLLTDGDEMAIMIDDANQSYGHAVKGAHVCGAWRSINPT